MTGEFDVPPSPSRGAIVAEYRDALNATLGNPLSRRILIGLETAGRELGYEELRRLTGGAPPQVFKNAFDRVHKEILVGRRLESAGDHYRTHIRLTRLGRLVAQGLRDAAGQPATSLPMYLRAETRRVLLGSPA